MVLQCTFVTSLIIKSDLTFLIQILSSRALKFKNPRPSHFFFQTGIDPRIHQLSFLISLRPFWERLKRKMLNQIYLTVILRGRAGYELIYITNEAVGRVGYYQLISGKSEKNNCFSKFSSNSLDFFG